MTGKKNTNREETGYFTEKLGFNKKMCFFWLSVEFLTYGIIVGSRFMDGWNKIAIPVSFTGLTLITLIIAGFTVSVYKLQLETTVGADGIQYRMRPFERKGHLITPGELEKFYIKRTGLKKRKTVIHLRLKNGKVRDIQTVRPKEFLKAIHRLMEENLKSVK